MKTKLIRDSIDRVSSAFKSGEKSQKVIDDNSKFFVSHFEEVIQESSFFKLPMKFLRKLLKQINLSDYQDPLEMFKLILNKATKYHSSDSAILLHSIKHIEDLNLTLEDCIDLIGQLSSCELCLKLYKLHEFDQTLPQYDYDYQIKQQNKQIEALKGEIEENQTIVKKHKETFF